MYLVSKRMEIAGAHQLRLPYESKCENLHGHNWIVTVYCCSTKLTPYGMVVDFKKVKEAIHSRLDHQSLNAILPDVNPTAENVAAWIANEVGKICEVGYCYKVVVQESEGNVATYVDPRWATLISVKEALG